MTDVAGHLPRLFKEVLVPPAVIDELASPRSPAIVQQWIASPPAWFQIVAPRNAPDILGLDRGETQAIWLCEEYGIKSILIDERKGTRVARDRGFRVAGTLAVVERLAERGWVSFDEVITRLRMTTFRYNEQIIDDIRIRLRSKQQ